MTTTFTLKNLKVCEWASEETTCFTATLYVDGKRVGECSNDGHGGADRYGFNEKPFAEIATEWLYQDHIEAAHKYGWSVLDRSDFTPNFEVLICELVQKSLLVKDCKAWKAKLVKKYPAAESISVYLDGDKMFASFSAEETLQILAKNPSARPAPTEAKVVI